MTKSESNRKMPPKRNKRGGLDAARPIRRPGWLKVAPLGSRDSSYEFVRELLRDNELNTVCKEARCPNIYECWGNRTATFLLLGRICTRSCGFCDIETGRPQPVDWSEPDRVARAVQKMKLSHAVLTSVNRDERKDGGAPIFALTIKRIRELAAGCTVEVLIPDFKGDIESLKIVIDAGPDILNHNVETVPRLFKRVQPQDKYEWALATLSNAKALNPRGLTKSGMMVGLGESTDEVVAVMSDLVNIKVDILTIGQYLQPTRAHLPIERYYTPEEFGALKEIGLEMGFQWVESGPLVRSSYHASNQARLISLSTRVVETT